MSIAYFLKTILIETNLINLCFLVIILFSVFSKKLINFFENRRRRILLKSKKLISSNLQAKKQLTVSLLDNTNLIKKLQIIKNDVSILVEQEHYDINTSFEETLKLLKKNQQQFILLEKNIIQKQIFELIFKNSLDKALVKLNSKNLNHIILNNNQIFLFKNCD